MKQICWEGEGESREDCSECYSTPDPCLWKTPPPTHTHPRFSELLLGSCL